MLYSFFRLFGLLRANPGVRDYGQCAVICTDGERQQDRHETGTKTETGKIIRQHQSRGPTAVAPRTPETGWTCLENRMNGNQDAGAAVACSSARRMTSIRKVCKSGLSEVVATWYPGPFFIWKAAGDVS